jgi:hypothetical protein
MQLRRGGFAPMTVAWADSAVPRKRKLRAPSVRPELCQDHTFKPANQRSWSFHTQLRSQRNQTYLGPAMLKTKTFAALGCTSMCWSVTSG